MYSVTSHNQFKYALSPEASPRLHYSIYQIILKPFVFKERKIGLNLISEIIKKINNGTTDDCVIYQEMHKYMNNHFYKKFGYPNNESEGRSDSRVSEIKKIVQNVNNLPHILNYTDIGCSEGGITHKIGELFHLTKGNIHGFDIIPIENVKNREQISYTQVSLDNFTLSLPTDSCQVVTALMVLHHLQHPDKYLKEIYRILEPGGILIIREHDIDSDNDVDGQVFLDILHGMYSVVWAKEGHQENKEHCNNYYAKYRSREYWTKLITSINFKNISTSNSILRDYYTMSHVTREYKEKKYIKNLMHSYWAVYQK